MSNFLIARIRMISAMFIALLLVAACGGGTSLNGVGSGGTGFVSGSVVKGPVGSATVTAYGIAGGQVGAPVGTATTDASGNFTMAVGSYAGSLMLQVSGGTYTDEATGTTMTLAPGDVMTAVMPSITSGVTTNGIQVTPVTAMAQSMASNMAGGMTDANITAANTALGNYFLVSDILHVQPMNPLATGSGTGASQDAQNYGMTLAAMSKQAQVMGMNSSSALVTAMMNDASDNLFDGKARGAAVQMGGMGGMGGGSMMPSNTGTSGLGAAMNAFMSSAQNKSGIMTATLMDKLNGASGQIHGSAPPATGSSVSGTAFNGPMSKATVTAFAVNNGVMGAQIASMATDSQGNFSMSMGGYSGPVLLQMRGGTYTDEASKTNMTMAANDVMSVALPTPASAANITGVWITPVTSMAQVRATGMTGGMTDANIAAANTAMGSYFAVSDIVHTQPMNTMVAGAAASTSQDARNYGMLMAAMSQYAKTLNMANSSGLVTAMMSDAYDGVMDGKNGPSQISMSMGGMMGSSMMAPTAGTSGMATAMTDFLNSAANASGLATPDMAALVQKLATSDGKI